MSEANIPTDFISTLYADNLGRLVLGKEHLDGTVEYQVVKPSDLNDIAKFVTTTQALHQVEYPVSEEEDPYTHVAGSGPNLDNIRAVHLPESED